MNAKIINDVAIITGDILQKFVNYGIKFAIFSATSLDTPANPSKILSTNAIRARTFSSPKTKPKPSKC